MYLAYAIIFTIAYYRMRKGKDSLLKKTEMSGKIYVSFDGGLYDYSVTVMNADQKEEWYSQYCNEHHIINPIAFIIPTFVVYIFVLCLVIVSNDFKGFFEMYV